MLLPRFDFRKARKIEEALELFEKSRGKAAYLAGGTDLVPRLKMRLTQPSLVIDLKGIDEMEGIKREDGYVSIGANVTIFELRQDSLVKEKFPALLRAASLTSCETLQMRGTIGGNILQDTRCLFFNKSLEWRKAKGLCFKAGGEYCHAVRGKNVCFSNYQSDLAPALLSLDAQLVLFSKSGERRIKLSEIYTDDGKNPHPLEEGEILIRILIKDEKRKGNFEKIRIRGSIDYPLVNGAVSQNKEETLIVIGAIGPKPKIFKVEGFDERSIEELVDRVYKELKPVENTVVRAEYRRRMGSFIVKRFFEMLKEEG